jgi:hypothetical protein
MAKIRLGKILNIDRKILERLDSLEDKFRGFLRKRDPHYDLKIKFDVLYSHMEEAYEINISSLRKKFNSQEYLKKEIFFERESEINELDDFCQENNVWRVRY